MRILAIGSDNTDQSALVDTATGELTPASALGFQVVKGEGGLLVGCNLYGDVGRLNEVFGDFPGWTIQIQSKERRLLRGTGRLVIGSFLPIYFGFVTPRNQRASGTNGSGRRVARRLFHCMDLSEIADVREVTVWEALDYAKSIVGLCEARGVKFTASRGGLATRLLKASPKWEKGRRAAPRFVNEHAREQLPGNYYGLGTTLRKTHRAAIYVDQISSHHSVALSTPVPHPHYIRARGNYRTLDRAWITDAARIRQFMGEHIGLVAAMVSVSHIPNHLKHLYPPFMQTPGRRIEYVYTNEYEYFGEGTQHVLEYIVAAWTSPIADPVVPEYAAFALRERELSIGRKSLLLAAYGSLAQRTDRPLTNYLTWRGKGMRTMLPGAGYMNEKVMIRRPDQPQPTVINVLARGVIEAETRKRSILLARDFHGQGVPVLSIYVDGLILETDRLPFLPDGWEVEAHLTDVQFQHPNSYTSVERTRQPGVPRPTGGDQARRMMLAVRGVPPEQRLRHAEAMAERTRVRSARMLRAAAWRERQGVL